MTTETKSKVKITKDKQVIDSDAIGSLDELNLGSDAAEKSLGNTDVNGAKSNVSDLVVYGEGDTFKLICKASSKVEGWMKSTKAMQIDGVGCVVQVTTQQGNQIAEALTFVPGVKIISLIDGGRALKRM